MGRPEPSQYISLALSTPQNRIILGTVGIGFLVVALLSLISSLKVQKPPKSIIINNTLVGQVSITVPAIKVIIMKAIKKVEGVKEVKSDIKSAAEGVVVNLHIMIDPELSVPETTKSIQNIVKQYLEEIGGMPVAEIKVLVDDFGTNQPATI